MIRTWQAFIALLLMPALFSCASYRQRIENYYTNLQQGDYKTASELLDKNRLLQHKRNRLLYYLEKGYTLHLLKQYDSSNIYLNAADKLLEAPANAVKNLAVSTILNPMMKDYDSEDFERFMMHYYKALNYLYLNKIDEALVEARRISLAQNVVAGKHSVNSKKYTGDAFALILQGLLYEKDNDINNAFISYRNAANIYLKEEDKTHYGVKIPSQLKKDVLRTAYIMGFYNDVSYYEKAFNYKFEKSLLTDAPELIIFTEIGMAPIKTEKNTFFTLMENNGGFFFTDYLNQHQIPVDYSIGLSSDNIKNGLKKVETFRLALTDYFVKPVNYSNVSIMVDSLYYTSEKIEDINVLAQSVLKERFLKEASLALSRLLLKKLAEKEVKKKDKDLGELVEAFNFFSEKADTRSWQSLPAAIYYSRIPIKPEETGIKILLKGRTQKTITATVDPKQKLNVINIREMQ